MGFFSKKTNPRRNQVRRTIGAERPLKASLYADADVAVSFLLWLVFLGLCIAVLSFGMVQEGRYRALAALAVLTFFMAVGAAFYVGHYQPRLLRNHSRALGLVLLFPFLLAIAKLSSLSSNDPLWEPN